MLTELCCTSKKYNQNGTECWEGKLTQRTLPQRTHEDYPSSKICSTFEEKLGGYCILRGYWFWQVCFSPYRKWRKSSALSDLDSWLLAVLDYTDWYIKRNRTVSSSFMFTRKFRYLINWNRTWCFLFQAWI